ncbi:MAG: Peptidase rane alanine aminopeptidase [Gemmatimonadetes bacterium]|nr:Peptidase rane alanine aminopeptidase [Gemmatimonadota bacterium]
MKRLLVLACLLGAAQSADAQQRTFTRADTLRGSITPERAWWDVAFYDLHVRVSPADSSIRGVNGITYRVTGPSREMQVDLQAPLVADSVVQDGRVLATRREGNVLYVTPAAAQQTGSVRTVSIHYHGRPRVAQNAPWDGGFVWARDSLGNPWVATAVQGLGASAWWPTKDTQADEPDSQRVAITVPTGMTDVSNGRLRSTTPNGDGTTTYEWFVQNPINNYGVSVNAGSYAHFSDVYQGEAGALTLDFWPLAYHEAAARAQFAQARPMLACFEHWFGPYPWYADGYKLVETPHLGMEHQSAVAYGNQYHNGYLGRDLSGTGEGMSWDYIIIHESAHEWWGNNLTTADIADMWVHEAFAMYAEALYVECQSGRAAGGRYVTGVRRAIRNDAPIIGAYGVQDEGSGDMYYKGANMLHTIRQLVNDDERWRGILRGLQSTFRHQIVTGRQVQEYMSAQSGIDLSRVFQQYLTTTRVPTLEYSLGGGELRYRWTDVVPGFDMPVRVGVGPTDSRLLRPTEAWQSTPVTIDAASEVTVDRNYYVRAAPR